MSSWTAAFIYVAFRLLGWREQPNAEFDGTHQEGWHPSEEKQRCYERRYWLASILLTFVIALGAGFSALYAHDQLIATTRARLELVAITDAYVTKSKDADAAWFKFKPVYKHFGPSPAEGTVFEPHIFVVGAGPPPEEACRTGPGWTMGPPDPGVIFQGEGGDWIGVQVPLQELKAEAAKVLTVQPSATVYLGVIGCLLYRSGSGTNTYVTGVVGDLHRLGGQQDDPKKYVPLYNVLVSGPEPVEVGMKVKILSAWAD